MENKDPNNLDYGLDAGLQMPGESAVHAPPPDADALSYEPQNPVPLTSQGQQPTRKTAFLRFARRADVILIVMLLVAATGVLITATHKKQQNNATTMTSDRFGSVAIPLDELVSGKNLAISGAANVTINGTLQLSDNFYLTPSLQPTGAKAGQIYFDQGTNQLAYYNGNNFVFLTDPSAGSVQSLGGATGQLTLASGLTLSNGQLANSGVLSVQGQAGDVTFTAGAGIVLNGTNFSNSGVISVAAGTPNVTVDDDGSGNVTISVDSPIGGTGTVTSSGGTVGHVPIYTGSQNIEDSIITQAGLTVTISGDLSVVTGGLSLSNALTVSNGGTGSNSLAANGILVGQGTAAVASVAAGGAGLCLLSTAGTPTWAACPSSSGVVSINGLNGALNIANASAAGSTITIDNASTSNKGIASFSPNNFTVNSGDVNTIQDINSSATPTFAGVNTNNITPSAALTVGVSAQTALLQGSTTTITSNGAGNNIVLNSAGTIELQDNTNVTGNVVASGDLTVNGGDIISTGALTVGSASQTLTLQGGAATSFRATSGANTTVVAFTSPTANTTLNFPALAAGTYTICTTSGNCAGAATTLQGAYDNSSNPEFVLDATRGALTVRDNSTPLGANLLEVQNNAGSVTYLAVTASGIAVTGTAVVSGNVNSTSGSLQTNGTTRIDNAGNATNIGTLTLSGAISGGTTFTGSGNINSTGGGIQTNGTTRVDNGGNLINIAAVTASGSATFQGGSMTLGTNSQAGTVVLNDGSSNTGTLEVAALGQNTTYILPDPGASTATICLTSGNCAGSGGGVTTGGGTTNRLAKFTGTQVLGDSSISDDGTNVTVSVDVIIQGGDLTVGSASQAASIVLNDGNGQTTTLQAGDSAGNLNFILPTNTGTANQCLKQSGAGNQLVWQDCDGGAGGSSTTLQMAYNNSTNPEIVLNSSVGGLTIRDNSTPLGANLFEIQNNAGSTTYFNVTVSGVAVNGTATATGNVNTSGGSLQTNGTTRIDNAGNAVNIGNITGSGPITIASIGAGSDITINGADQFIVQDTSVFNALATFNANIDLGANDIVGTTGNINLTNFDVVGTTGNVTAGTYNGQTISSSANFTGTVAVAGNLTLTSDMAVNGGDLTSSGALNITPGGTLTVGVTGQQLILQGNANTQLTATGSGFTTTVGFTGTPAAAVTYNFDRAAAAGTYSICTTVGNCAGVGGGVTTPGGTTGALAKFTGSQTLGDSLLSESGSTITVNGNLNLVAGNQFRVNGTQISSANLSNDANLAKLSASQTFTGATVAFVNGSNSTNAFNVQNAAGNRLLTVDTSGAQVVLGTSNVVDGRLVFASQANAFTATLAQGALTANRTLTLPDSSGIVCLDSGNCMGAGATLQTGYNFSTGGTTPKIKVNSTLLGVDIQDADTTIAANLFNVRASNGSGLGSVMFGVGNTGAITMQNSANSTAAFRLLTAGGTSVLTGDTTNGQIILGQSSTLNGSLVFNNSSNANTTTLALTAPSVNRTITLPNATGTICLTSGNCSGTGSSNTLQAAYDAGNTITTSTARDINFALADTSTDSNFLVDLQCDTSCGSNGRFAVQDDGTDILTIAPAGGALIHRNSVNSTSAFQIQNAVGTGIVFNADTTNGRVGIGTVTPGYALDVVGDINTSVSYRIGGVQICTGTGCTASAASAIQNQFASVQSANFRIQSNGSVSTNTATIQGIASQTADLLQFQSSGGSPVAGIRPSGTIWSAPVTDPNTDVPANARLFLQPLSNAGNAIIARASAGGAPTGDILQLQNASGSANYLTVGVTGIVTSKASGTSGAAFDIQDTNGDSLLRVDTASNMVKIGYEAGGTANGANAALVIGDDCSGNLHCVSIYEGNELDTGTGGDTDVLQLQGGNGIRFSTSFSSASAMVITNTGQVGIGTEDPDSTLNVVGNVTVQDAATATKNFRFRTSGASLDLEGSGADLYLSSWTGADFTGTQQHFLRGFIGTSGNSYNDKGLFVGSGGATSTPMVLVLDEKSSGSGVADPAGASFVGAMYYNRALESFRCYQNTSWRNCLAGITKVTSAQATTSTSYANVPGLTWTVTPNTDYAYRCQIVITSAATTTGFAFANNVPASPTLNKYVVRWQDVANNTASTAATREVYLNTADGMTAYTSVVTASSYLNVIVEGNYSSGATGGTFAIRYASEVGGSAITVQPGSSCTYY